MDKDRKYINWSKNELLLLIDNSELAPTELVKLFPNRTYNSVLSKKNKLINKASLNKVKNESQIEIDFIMENPKHEGTLYTVAAMKEKIKSQKVSVKKVKSEIVKNEKVKHWSEDEKNFVFSYHYLPINILKVSLPNRTLAALKNYLFRNNLKVVDEVKYNPHTIKIITEFMETRKLGVKDLIELVKDTTGERLSINGIKYMLKYTNENSYRVFDNVIKTIFYIKHHNPEVVVKVETEKTVKVEKIVKVETPIVKTETKNVSVNGPISEINEILNQSIVKIQELTIDNSELINRIKVLEEKNAELNEKLDTLSEVYEKQRDNVEALATESKSRWSIIKKVFF